MADKIRKPVPKNQRELSISEQNALLSNPNTAVVPLPVFKNETNPATAKGYRAQQISVKGDSDKPYVVGLQDIDEAILYYFENIIKPSVEQNGTRIAVPIIYGNPERWKAVQKDGYYRDKNGRIMCPVIMFKSNTVEKDYTVANKLDANNPQNYAVVNQKYQKNTPYNQFDLLNNRKPVETYQAVVIPDYVTLTYDCTIWTYYREQMNKIIEAVNYSSDSYWGDPNRFKFRARIDSFTDNTTMEQGQERLVRSSFNIKLRGYIIPEVIAKDLNSIKKFYTKGKITISAETVSDITNL